LACGMNEHIGKPIDWHVFFRTLAHWVKPNIAPHVQVGTYTPGSHIPEIDLADKLLDFELTGVMGILQDNQEKLLAMLANFYKQFISEGPAIVTNINANNIVKAKSQLHALKGVAGNLGAVKLYQASVKLEEALNSETFDSELIAQWQNQFDSTMHSLKDLQVSSERKINKTASHIQ